MNRRNPYRMLSNEDPEFQAWDDDQTDDDAGPDEEWDPKEGEE